MYLSLGQDREYYHWGLDNEDKITLTKQNVKASNQVLSIDLVIEDDEVYDIETMTSDFQCGVGSIIAKNTDSIFTKFKLSKEVTKGLNEKEILDKTAEIAEECGRRITETFISPINLEFEKVLYPLLLLTKKRYAYTCWEPGKGGTLIKKGIDVKGLQLIKREYCPFVKHIGNAILDKILNDHDPDGAEEVAQKMINDLLTDKVDIKDLIMTKALRSKYREFNKNGRPLTKPAHWYLAEKMRKRDPMNAPKGGERVQYVYVETKNPKAKDKDRIEDPEYTLSEGLKIDTLYYLDKQVMTLMYEIFSCILTDQQGKVYEIIKGKYPPECKRRIQQIWENLVVQKKNRQKREAKRNFFNSFT